jgi:hypothetical protein
MVFLKHDWEEAVSLIKVNGCLVTIIVYVMMCLKASV